MTVPMLLVLAILLASLVLFVTEWVRMDLVALLVMSSLAVLGLVSPQDAVSGFSNPAVITVWAMFIMSEGLSRAGIADLIGRQVTRFAGTHETRLVAVFMVVAGVLSAFMNNIGVAALLLPVAVEVARRAGVVPSRLLMPLAYGTLLGGLMTIIGTPPNLLVHIALRDADLPGFGFFDFAWIGVPILLAGTAFVAVFGRHILPSTDTTGGPASQRDLRAEYGLQERIFALRVPEGPGPAGHSIGETGLVSAAGLLIIALTRRGATTALPASGTRLEAGDVLLAQGRLDQFERLRAWSALKIEREAPDLHERLLAAQTFAELTLAEDAALAGERLRHDRFRERFGVNVLAIARDGGVRRTRLSEHLLAPGDRLLVQGAPATVAGLTAGVEFATVAPLEAEAARQAYRLDERIFVLRAPQDAVLPEVTLGESRLGDAFDFRLLAVFRGGEILDAPPAEQVLGPGDLLLVQGRDEDLDVLRALQPFETVPDPAAYLGVFDEGALDLVEAVVHPHSTLAGQRVAELKLSERFELTVAAIWRRGRPYRSGLGAMVLEPGDGLLLIGPRSRLAAFEGHDGLVMMTRVTAPQRDAGKAPLAGGLMLGVVAVVLAGLLPISVAAVAGATLMVLTRCLDMEQAYRAIDWRSIFLIAGMLPLGIAMQQSGAAQYLADGMLGVLGPLGPWPVIAGLYAVTALGTLIVPTAALVLLVAPIALSAAAELGISPYPAVMAVAIAASASFASPVAHPANILVMGPGGYRFADYLKLGVPMTILVFAVAMLLLPVVWPLTP